jgi:hypothetical protein
MGAIVDFGGAASACVVVGAATFGSAAQWFSTAGRTAERDRRAALLRDRSHHDLGIDVVRSYRGPSESLTGTIVDCPATGKIAGADPGKALCCLPGVWP